MLELPEYSSDSVWYPTWQNNDPDKRDKSYYFKNVKSFYFQYYNNQSLMGFNSVGRVDFLRAFAEGRQYQAHKGEYKEQPKELGLDVNGNKVQVKKSDFPDIDWNCEIYDILSPANKIMESLYGSVSKIEYEINCDPLDYATIHKQENKKLRAWSDSRIQDKVNKLAEMAGIQMPQPEFVPEDRKDLDLAAELGEFTEDHVRYVEQLVKHTFDISHWSPDIKELFYRDLFILNRACIKNDYDPEDGKIHATYVDPKYADTQNSVWMDCRDNERWWHFYTIPLSTLRQYFPEKDEKWFQTVAKSYCGQFDNPLKDYFDKYNTADPLSGTYPYDSFKVAIGNFEWIDINTQKYVRYNDKFGRSHNKEIPLSEDVSDLQDKKIRFKEERIRYAAKWVLGTDEIFEWGLAYDQTAFNPETGIRSKSDTEPTYFWIVRRGKSITEQLVPIYKNFQDLWEKYRELLRQSQGKTREYDIDQLASTRGENDSPQDAANKAVKQHLATGLLFKRSVNAAGVQQQKDAISEKEGGMGVLFNEILLGIETNMKMVEFITGLNPLSLGEQPKPEAPVGTSELAYQATSTTISPFVESYKRMLEMLSGNASRWINLLVRSNEYSREQYKEVVGDLGIASILAATKSDADYGFRIIARPNITEKQFILQNIERASTPDQGGNTTITPDDADILINMVMSNSPMKTIQAYFKKARKKQSDLLMKQKTALMQQQSKLNQDDANNSAAKAKETADYIHGHKMDEIKATNDGIMGKTVAGEQVKLKKDVTAAIIKSDAAKEIAAQKQHATSE